MKKRFTILTAAIVICLTFIFTSQTGSRAAFGSGLSQPPVGKNCIIQFRRGDALGAGANLPIAPLTGSINGAETGVGGKLLNVTEDWIVIESNGSNLWIPKSSILLIQVGIQ